MLQGAAGRKRKATETVGDHGSKRIALASCDVNRVSPPESNTVGARRVEVAGDPVGDARDAGLSISVEFQRQSYHSSCNQYRSISSDQKDHVLEPALDDMVNARTRGFNCRRQPPTIYFGNDRCGKWEARTISLRVSSHTYVHNGCSKERPPPLRQDGIRRLFTMPTKGVQQRDITLLRRMCSCTVGTLRRNHCASTNSCAKPLNNQRVSAHPRRSGPQNSNYCMAQDGSTSQAWPTHSSPRWSPDSHARYHRSTYCRLRPLRQNSDR